MAKAKGGLGRGLGALIPQGPPVATAPRPEEVTVEPKVDLSEFESDLAPVPGPGRGAVGRVHRAEPPPAAQDFAEESMEELRASIPEVGFLQPIVVREVGHESYEPSWGSGLAGAQSLAWTPSRPSCGTTPDDSMRARRPAGEHPPGRPNPLERPRPTSALDEFGVTHAEARPADRPHPPSAPTRSGCSISPVASSAEWRRACCPPVTHGLCSRSRSPTAGAPRANRIVAEGMSVRATEEAVRFDLAEGAPAKKASARRPKPHAPGLNELAERLPTTSIPSASTSTAEGPHPHRVFATVDDLERIVSMIGPDPWSGLIAETVRGAERVDPLGPHSFTRDSAPSPCAREMHRAITRGLHVQSAGMPDRVAPSSSGPQPRAVTTPSWRRRLWSGSTRDANGAHLQESPRWTTWSRAPAGGSVRPWVVGGDGL